MNVEQKARELHKIHDRWLAEETDEGFIEYLARALEQPEGREAVAWMVEFKDGAVSFLREETQASMFDAMEAKVTPLYTTPPAKVPEGYVLVPSVPTPEMLRAGFLTGVDDFELDQPADAPGLVYRAMLAAAQQPKEGA